MVALGVASCGTSGGGSGSAASSAAHCQSNGVATAACSSSGRKVAKNQSTVKHQQRECELAAREIDRTERERIKEIVQGAPGELKELNIRAAVHESAALSNCK